MSASFVGRLFDIVSLDEGTCGRRLWIQQLQGVGNSVKFKSFHKCLVEVYLGRITEHVLIYVSIYVIKICAGTAP